MEKGFLASDGVVTRDMTRDQIRKGLVITVCFVIARLAIARMWGLWFDLEYHLTLPFLIFLGMSFVVVSLGLVYYGFTRWVGVDVKSWWIRPGRVMGDIKWAMLTLILGGIVFLVVVLGLYFLNLVPPDLMAVPQEDAPMDQILAQIPVNLVLGRFFGFALAAYTEETIFRGFIMGLLADRVGSRTANVLQALLFSLSHIGMTPLVSIGAGIFGVLFRFASGCVFGWLKMKRGNLLASGIVHGIIG